MKTLDRFVSDLSLIICLQLTSTKPYLRKKAVLMMYKVFLRFPEALRPAFPRLKEKLEDPDSGELRAVRLQLNLVNLNCREVVRKPIMGSLKMKYIYLCV
jgi:hypothetical protein